MRTIETRSLRWVCLLLVLTLALGACGGDDTAADADAPADTSADDGADSASTPADTEPAEESAPDDGTDAAPVQITAVDYAFDGVPASIEPGTALSLTNASDGELHELILVPMPEDDDRTAAELMELPLEELEPLFAGVMDVIVAAPGTTDQPGAVAGDGVVEDAGRYMLICQIPTGADPAGLMEAAQNEDPEALAAFDGEPHYQQGMIAELIVG